MKKFFGGKKISFDHPFWRQALLLAPLLFFLLIFSLPFAQTRGNDDVSVKENNFTSVEGASDFYDIGERRSDPQLVLISFDGSRSLEKWQDSLNFAKELNDKGVPFHLTYFISGVYFIKPEFKEIYKPFGYMPGYSFIGYGRNDDDITQRVDFINRAKNEGHEIASHLNGHMDGSFWSQDVWKNEIQQFNRLVFFIQENNQNKLLPELNILPSDIKGMRAPSLGVNSNLWPALAQSGYKYDSSQTGEITQWPLKDQYGIWHFYFPNIKMFGTNKYILPSDYNLFLAQSNCLNKVKKGEALWNDFKDQAKKSYLEYYWHNYNGMRAPIVIAHHFSDWNDGAYYEALKEFALEVCGQKDTRCITFSQAVEYLERKTSP